MSYSQTLRLVANRCHFVRGFRTSTSAAMPIKVGDSLPTVDLFENDPGTKVNTAAAFGNGKHILIGIVGAFTPTCQNEHIPTFVSNYTTVKEKGVESVNCISVNDPFVMAAFGQALKAGGKVRMLADTTGAFTKAVDLELDLTGPFGNKRSTRYVMVVEDGKVTGLNVEADPAKATCSRAQDVTKLL